jgi:NADPH2:quinone reductase
MRVVRYTAAGGVEVLALDEAPTPSPGGGQILVRVHAAGLNRADILQRRGGYPAPAGWPADIPGLEYAGIVEATGPGVTHWRAGDRVMGLVGGGAHAEYVAVHEDEAIPIPDGMTLAEAGAVPEAFLTAWDALVHRGRVRAGERVLLHAVGSGVGTAAVQLAKRLGATTIGTSRTAAKLEQARALGLDEAVETSAAGFRDRVAPAVDVILDVLGGPAFADNLAVLAPRGRLVLLGFLQGAETATSLGPILRKRLEVIGTVMRTRGPEERRELAREFTGLVLPWFGTAGEAAPLRPVPGAMFDMEAVAEAHRAMEEDRVFGKIVLVW